MIDDKGRLFGLINVIDLIVILLVVALAGGFLWSKRDTGPVTVQTATVKVICPYVRPEVAEQLKVGDQLMARGQLQPVYVTELTVVTARDTGTAASGELMLQQHPFRQDMYITLEGPISFTGSEIYMAGQQIRAGLDKYTMKTQKFEVLGEILGIEINS
jgi:hypothetical protein